MKRTRIALVVPFLAMLGAACGQIGGVHGAPGAPVAAGAPGASSAAGYADSGALHGVPLNVKSFGGNSTRGHGRVTTRRVGNKLITKIKRRVGNKIITTIKTTIAAAPPVLSPAVLNQKGPLYICPVQGQFSVGDDFGAPRYTTNPPHPHAGNDIFAPMGTPIVAPFDGVAYADPNTLGGNAVVVRGRDGYVYNAHLSAYGKMGAVHAGEIVGYVGNSGDAQGGATHDHFEWHPYAGPTIPWVSTYGFTTVDSGSPVAVDPYPYLYEACHGGLPT